MTSTPGPILALNGPAPMYNFIPEQLRYKVDVAQAEL
jgi:hypothetical protein